MSKNINFWHSPINDWNQLLDTATKIGLNAIKTTFEK